jgi:hypothetical protein
MELSQEHFDRQLENLQSNISSNIKSQIQAQTDELKNYIHESFETQQVYIDERFAELFDGMKVKEEVAQLKEDIVQIKAALHLP